MFSGSYLIVIFRDKYILHISPNLNCFFSHSILQIFALALNEKCKVATYT